MNYVAYSFFFPATEKGVASVAAGTILYLLTKVFGFRADNQNFVVVQCILTLLPAYAGYVGVVADEGGGGGEGGILCNK